MVLNTPVLKILWIYRTPVLPYSAVLIPEITWYNESKVGTEVGINERAV